MKKLKYVNVKPLNLPGHHSVACISVESYLSTEEYKYGEEEARKSVVSHGNITVSDCNRIIYLSVGLESVGTSSTKEDIQDYKESAKNALHKLDVLIDMLRKTKANTKLHIKEIDKFIKEHNL